MIGGGITEVNSVPTGSHRRRPATDAAIHNSNLVRGAPFVGFMIRLSVQIAEKKAALAARRQQISIKEGEMAELR